MSPNSPRTPVTAVINHRRHSAQKSLEKSLILVDVNNLGLLADLPEKSLKPCSGRGSGPIVKIVILVTVWWASSLNTVALIKYSLKFKTEDGRVGFLNSHSYA